MNQLLTGQQLHGILAPSQTRGELSGESPLCVAANMLSDAHVDEMSATTVVGVLGRDDENAFRALVTEIADELDLDARVRLHGGSFSVRFTRPLTQMRHSRPAGERSLPPVMGRV
jgi:hypothetical protein